MVSSQKIEFATWLEKQIEKRGWSYREFSRRGELSSGAVSKVINRHSFPGPEFCHGVARALGVPPERVFRKAGLLPPHIIGDEAQDRKNELLDYFEALDEQRRQTALALIRTLYEQQGPYAAELRPGEED